MQMKMEKTSKKFDRNKMKKLLEEENEFIVDLLTTVAVPDSVDTEDYDEMFLLKSKKNRKLPTAKTKRAQTVEELEDRLQIIKNKMQSRKSKMSERTKKKREMKKLKKNKEFKKILTTAHKALKNEKMKEEKLPNGGGQHAEDDDDDVKDVKKLIKPIKPIFNQEGKIVFSKFDFAAHPGAKVKKSKKDRVIKNPKLLLKNLKQQKRQMSELIEQGEKDKVLEMKQELSWKRAFDKTEGKKVKDDPTLLVKAIKKRKIERKKSKQNWRDRKQKVEQDIAQRQKKRQDNIQKKIKEKKTKKLKKLTKRGRVIPGF